MQSVIKLKKIMATHSSILAWETPWTEEPGRGSMGKSMESQRVGHMAEQLNSKDLAP